MPVKTAIGEHHFDKGREYEFGTLYEDVYSLGGLKRGEEAGEEGVLWGEGGLNRG